MSSKDNKNTTSNRNSQDVLIEDVLGEMSETTRVLIGVTSAIDERRMQMDREIAYLDMLIRQTEQMKGGAK